ncbi:metallophosphoesterase (plasmid) [Acidithiobacillus ferriphilus]|uniref:metallophosphoesterase n=1 Tax=Acidithiobacillus ferriphilus TaxID=1689834 RepID=UPI00390C5BCD
MANNADFLQTQPAVIHHDTNINAHDFIVGDLHGCRAMLDTLLAHVGFDGSRDRLFSVGDLVDRGPDSEGCLDLLHEPWFFPVLGNHDAMLMAMIMGEHGDERSAIYTNAFVHNGGLKWASRFTRADEFLPLLEAMPLVRVIGKDADSHTARGVGRFHVAHAELRMPADAHSFTDLDLDCVDRPLWDMEHFIPGFGSEGDWRDHLLWGRSLIQEIQRCARDNQPLPQERYAFLSTTYVGHTIMPPAFGPGQNEPLRMESHVFLDSGAFKAAKDGKDGNPRYGLTLWCHTENRGWLLNGANNIREIG